MRSTDAIEKFVNKSLVVNWVTTRESDSEDRVECREGRAFMYAAVVCCCLSLGRREAGGRAL